MTDYTTVHHGDVTIHHGDCLDVLAELPDASVDSVVCDPPYELAFMNKSWDNAGIAFDTAIWGHALRVLKPGGHLLAFGGSRTWHRLASAIEDSGFEIRDSIAWLYGSGFPKSRDVGKAIDKAAGATREVVGINDDQLRRKPNGRTGTFMLNGCTSLEELEQAAEMGGKTPNGRDAQKTLDHWRNDIEASHQITAPATDAAKQWQGWGTALKPAFEPIVVGRKPLIGTVAANVQAHGTGALNIDACRVGTNGEKTARPPLSTNKHEGYQRPWNQDTDARARVEEHRQEAHDKRDNLGRWPTNVVLDDNAAAELDTQSGITKGSKPSANGRYGEHLQNGDNEVFGKGLHSSTPNRAPIGDSGGASRFFPVFKYQAKAPKKERPNVDGIVHPTVKPLELMRWLVRLVTPPGGTVLDPFAGSGTTAEAAIREGMRCIAIEREAEYLPLILARISRGVSYTIHAAPTLEFGEPA